MPTAPDPNSPYMASRVEAELGVRGPGMPTMAGKPGVQAANVAFPAPPSPASAPVGRPATARPPAPAAPAQQAPSVPSAQPAAQAAPPPAAQPGQPAPAAPMQPAPLGIPTADGMSLTPEGDMAYRQAVMRGRDDLGPVPKAFRHPTLPELPFELGKPNYSPFTGRWSSGNGA